MRAARAIATPSVFKPAFQYLHSQGAETRSPQAAEKPFGHCLKPRSAAPTFTIKSNQSIFFASANTTVQKRSKEQR